VRIDLVAPCGMNCAICLGYIREKNRCLGCRKVDEGRSSSRVRCTIRNCPVLREQKMKHCSDACDTYPCRRLRSLDKRYRTRYGMSMIENLENIKRSGVREFVRNEKTRWECGKCGRTICVHRDSCLGCGTRRETTK
jgi:hypothetical protein